MEDFMQNMKTLEQFSPEMRQEAMKLFASPERVFERMGIDVASYGVRRTRKEILQQHEKKNKAVQKATSYSSTIHFSTPTTQMKPSSSHRVEPPSHFLPIHALSMHPGTTHRGRMLRGELIVDPVLMTSVQSVLEDELGEVVNVSFYNVGVVQEDPRGCSSMFRRGATLLIIEPYYKLNRDGSYGVRVDDFNDVIFIDSLGPISGQASSDWRAEGKCHFVAKQYAEAGRCFGVALSKCDSDVAAVLRNISAAHKLSSDYLSALHYAMAAARVTPENAKAKLRVAEALEGLEMTSLALHFCEEAAELGGSCGVLKARLLRSHQPQPETGVKPRSEIVQLLAVNNLPPSCYSNDDSSDKMSVGLAESKEVGNRYFYENDFPKALRSYEVALLRSEQAKEVSTLLSNLSACSLAEERFLEAAIEATAAILIDRSSVKAHYRRSMALLEMELPEMALAALKIAPDGSSIDQLRNRILRSKRKEKLREENHRRRGPTESDVNQAQSENYASTDAVGAMNNMMAMATATAATGKLKVDLFDDRLVPFHEVFARDGRWPLMCSVSMCQEKLWEAFEHARAQKRSANMLFSQQFVKLFEPLKQSNWTIRCGGPDTALWLQSSPPTQSVHFGDRAPYSLQVVHSFSNQPRTSIRLERGSTHVAVGFVDLGELLTAEFSDDEGVIRWVGYEASEYSIAKTFVIMEMLRSQVSTLDILQVWYSATWTRQALLAFQRAVATVLRSRESTDGTVRRILNHWGGSSGVALSEARRLWLEFHPRTFGVIADLKILADRAAMCSYLLSGDLVSDPDTGSVVMFALPEGVGCLSLDESVFEGIPSDLLFEYRNQRRCRDVVQAAVQFLSDKISSLSEMLSSGQLEVEVRLETLSPDVTGTLESIREDLSPLSMSWSNVCDYYAPREFHKMARNCSGKDTRHFLFPMNWPRDVCGAFILDFDELKTRKKLDCKSKVWMERLFKKHAMKSFLFVPSVAENPMNVVDAYLASTLKDVWVKTFLQASSRPITDSVVSSPVYNYFLRSGSTISLSYVYE